ncbi:hypothetical protein [Pseudomonas frederiksbergensis]|uniref:hypothetical protein n=1 Tax=Pseudomonas frederiksbergensis TaxID=104087 RepID=UPI0011CE8870|nr:hypothetical protein [Pseudomonas frederiksbergensis]
MLSAILAAPVLASHSASAAETAPGITDLTKPFNEYTWVMAHNGFLDEMREQLNRGVRGFMLDLHLGNLGNTPTAYLCHTLDTWKCSTRTDMKFSDALNTVFLPFLRSNPNAVVTVTLENYVDRDVLNRAFDAVPGLADMMFDPRAYSGSRSWPTLQQIIGSGKRLIMLTDGNPGEYVSNGKTLNLLKDSHWENQNYWDLGATTLKHDWSCPSRWNSYTPTVGVNGFTQWPRLFVMNQFHSFEKNAAHAGDVDNNLTYLERRVDSHCASVWGKRTAPNYLAVDYNHRGDTFPYAAALTQGGYYFYEQNRANAAGDTTCVIPAGKDYNFSLPAHGCENDEARSLKLRGVAKGTRIAVYDSSNGDPKDDHAFIDVKRDIGLNESVVVGTFETQYEDADFKLTYVRNNGLDGKVSRISVGKTPADFSDASVVLYEGNGAGQNIVCTVSLAHSANFNFKSGNACKNDEAKSARILRAKAGTSFSVYGNWDQNQNQGYARVDVLRDITQPVVVGSFDRNYDGGSWRITRGGSSSQLDGKVSSMRVQQP